MLFCGGRQRLFGGGMWLFGGGSQRFFGYSNLLKMLSLFGHCLLN